MFTEECLVAILAKDERVDLYGCQNAVDIEWELSHVRVEGCVRHCFVELHGLDWRVSLRRRKQLHRRSWTGHCKDLRQEPHLFVYLKGARLIKVVTSMSDGKISATNH